MTSTKTATDRSSAGAGRPTERLPAGWALSGMVRLLGATAATPPVGMDIYPPAVPAIRTPVKA